MTLSLVSDLWSSVNVVSREGVAVVPSLLTFLHVKADFCHVDTCKSSSKVGAFLALKCSVIEFLPLL